MTQAAIKTPADKAAQVAVHIARDKTERLNVYKFRFKVISEEIGLTGSNIDEKARSVHDDVDPIADQIYITRDHEIAASIRLLSACESVPSEFIQNYGLRPFQRFGPKALAFTGRMTVDARWRGSDVPSVLATAAFKRTLRNGALFDFTHCTPELVVLYERLGYRRYTDNFIHQDLGLQVPLVLVMHDLEHLKQVKSPFVNIVRTAELNKDSVNWFRRTFPDAVFSVAVKADEEQKFWDYLTDQLHQNPLYGIPLFDGMSFREAQQFLRSASIMHLKARQPLTRAGDVGREIYVILSGTVKVTSGRSKTVLAELNRGALVGELSFLSEAPRSADITVVDEAEVLVLSQDVFRQVVERIPQIAAKVLFNLSLILCERLKSTSALVGSDLPFEIQTRG
jgi:predicted GNAT family N-acyltransferase